ncbi:hypothetical protein NE865_09053 [Phthorimaea operculella]|nr:hypothetical protein NE865_09053 [Phthorimaea operculella]
MIGREDREDALLKSALQADERVRVVSEHLTECLMLLEEAPNPEDKELVEGDVSQCLELAQDIAQAAADISRRRDGKEKPFRGKVGQGLQVPLPPVTVPVFAGDYADWPAFEDLYSSVVHTRTDITPAYKMAQLMSRLHGEPHELLTHLAVSDSNYEVAWKILTDRYRNKRLIVDRLLDQWLSIPTITRGTDLREKIFHPVSVAVSALERQGLPVAGYGYILVHTVLRRLPSEMVARFEQLHGGKSSDHLPTYEDLKSFLEAESRRVDVQAGEAPRKETSALATRNGRVHRREEATVGNPGGTTPHWNQGVPTAGRQATGWQRVRSLLRSGFRGDGVWHSRGVGVFGAWGRISAGSDQRREPAHQGREQRSPPPPRRSPPPHRSQGQAGGRQQTEPTYPRTWGQSHHGSRCRIGEERHRNVARTPIPGTGFNGRVSGSTRQPPGYMQYSAGLSHLVGSQDPRMPPPMPEYPRLQAQPRYGRLPSGYYRTPAMAFMGRPPYQQEWDPYTVWRPQDLPEGDPVLYGSVLSEVLQRFLESEEPPTADRRKPEDDECELFYQYNTARCPSGRFVTRLPFLPNRPALVWRHVPGEWNPADCASRGCRAPDLVSHPLWWGPQWLTESPQEWPFNECRAPLGPPDRGLRVNVGQLVPKPNPAFLLERYSSLDKLLGVTGWIKRFVNNCRKPQAERNFTPVLSPAERNAALCSLVRVVQAEHFEEEKTQRETQKLLHFKMVKFENDYAKVLYKASFNSYSKTCTTISNQTRVTKKTSILRIKPSRHKLFYADKGKIKRDLSIETDLCKLRRRFKQKLMMLSHADAKSANTARTPISAKSRYSSYTQESPIEEFRSDNSGCGDNYETDPPRYRMNKEDLMYDNLNLLFETWVQQMLQDKDLKTLMHAAFEKPMKNSESKKEGKSSSCTTYLLDDINKISKSNSIEQSLNSSGEFFPPSFNTVPVTYKALRLISTLSLPKNMYGQKRKFRKYKTKLKTYRMKKRRNNKMLVKLIQPNMNIDEVSDINIGMIEVVTKSWLRRCVNIDENKIKGKMSPAQPQIVCWADVLPPPNVTHKYTEKITDQEVSTKNGGHNETKRTDTNTTTTFDKNNKNSNHTFKHCSRGDTILKKNVNTEYSYHKANVQTSTMLQEAGQRDPGVTSDILNQKHNYPDVILEEKQRTRTCCKASKKDIGILCKRSKSNQRFANNRTYDEYERKPFTRVDKKVKKNKKTKESVMNNLQNALNFFVKNTNRNFNFDLHMSVSPTKLQTYQHAATDVMKTTKYINRSCAAISIITSLTENKTKEKKYQKADGDQSHSTDNTDKPNPESINSRSPPNIIPLLDGAVSKDDNVFKVDSLTTDPKHLITKLPTNEEIQIQTSVTKELGLKDEINEIKMALRNITLLFDACIISQHKKHLNTPKSKKKLPDLSDNLSADADATNKLSDKTLPKSPITVPETKISRNKKQKFSSDKNRMQAQEEDKGEKVKCRRRSSIRFTPYIVAFAMKETYDDPKIESGKQSSSPNSSHPLNENNNTESCETAQKTVSKSDTTILQEIKINIDEDDLDFILTPPQKDCRLKGTENLATDKVNMDGVYKQPRVLLGGSKCKKRKLERKLRYHKKNNHSKIQITNKIEKNIQRFYSDKDSTVAELQKDLYEDCTTDVVSRCRVVKNALARENLLEAIDQDTENEIDHSHMDIVSLTSSTSTEKNSVRSQNNSLASQKTLTSKSIYASNNDIYSMEPQRTSSSYGTSDTLDTVKLNDGQNDHSNYDNDSDHSKSNDAISVHSKSSVIEVKSDNGFPFQSNVVKVALAVTETSKVQNVCDEIKESLRNDPDTRGFKFDTSSAELTSRDPSSNLFDPSIDTLIGTTSSMRQGSNTTLAILKNKSLSNRSGCSYALSANSIISPLYTFLTSDTLPNHVKTFSCQTEKSISKEWTTGSRVLLSQSIHKEEKSSKKTCKDTKYDARNSFGDKTGANDSYVTKTRQPKLVVDKTRTKCSRPRRSKGFLPQKNCLSANVRRYQNPQFATTPNEGTLKAMIEKVKTIDNLTNGSDENRAEIWEKVSLVLDVIAHRLEHTLTDKIIKEIKTLSSSQHANCEAKVSKGDLKKHCNFNENLKTDNNSYSHKSFQCSIVDNKMLDDMMLKLSMDGPKIIVQPRTKSIRIDEPVLYKDIEILKSPVVKDRREEIITVEESSLTTTSTLAADARTSNMMVHQKLKHGLLVSLKFLKENIFVMAAVPSFFVLIFLMYTLIAILAKLL